MPKAGMRTNRVYCSLLILALFKKPISVDGFGRSEGIYVYFFSFLGVPAAEAFLLGFVAHLLGNVLV